MSNPAQPLIDLKKRKQFLVCIDSDGCAFDAMEIKHKECFAPVTIKEWGLQPISKYAREVWEFVNLYSVWRGTNRFPALVKAFDLMKEREEIARRGFKFPDLAPLRKWIEGEPNLSNPFLEKAVAETGNPLLAKTLKWSRAVNKSIADMVHGVPPFPYVRKSLEKLREKADAVVVSATPGEALNREWQEHGLAEYIQVIAGQEMGTKKDHIRIAMAGRYDNTHVIKLGDAWGDYNAAKSNNVLFYPINPGQEEASWKRFFDEAFDRFIDGKYAGSYEEGLVGEFKKLLPAVPPWTPV
jgi:phosphoglycolate phosphatase-like HAD superfamily hydrolase